jgi:hypothetical protein
VDKISTKTDEKHETKPIEENKIFIIEEIKSVPKINKKFKAKRKQPNKKLPPIKNSNKTIRNQKSYMGIAKSQGVKFLRFNKISKSTRKVFNSSDIDIFAIENESQA